MRRVFVYISAIHYVIFYSKTVVVVYYGSVGAVLLCRIMSYSSSRSVQNSLDMAINLVFFISYYGAVCMSYFLSWPCNWSLSCTMLTGIDYRSTCRNASSMSCFKYSRFDYLVRDKSFARIEMNILFYCNSEI